MLDIKIFRNDPELVRTSQKARGASVELVDQIVDLDHQHLKILYAHEQIKRQINQSQKEIHQKMKNKEDCKELIANKKNLENTLLSTELENITKELHNKLSSVGNIVHNTVIVSMDEKDNEIVRLHGVAQPKPRDLKLKSHFEVMQDLDMVDTHRGSSIAGHRGYFLKNFGVRLNQALINYGLNFLSKKGYTLLQPPYYMFKNIIAETVQLSDYDDNLYKMVAASSLADKMIEDKYLIATSEQPISAYHRHEIIHENHLPLNYCGFSTCFRKEAGAHGKDIQGIFRVHQFEKIEQFCITKPEDSWLMFEKMIAISEEFYQNLGLHYRIVNIVSGALNNAAAKKYDLEAWFPQAQQFRELVSCSNCTNYQSVSMDIRMKRPNNSKTREFVHCLNSTLCATERTMCCIVENYQTENGLIIPEVLQSYLGIDFVPYKKTALVV